MKTLGYLTLIMVSVFTFTPRSELIKVPLTQVQTKVTNLDSLQSELDIKMDSLECMKSEVILLQTEIGIR